MLASGVFVRRGRAADEQQQQVGSRLHRPPVRSVANKMEWGEVWSDFSLLLQALDVPELRGVGVGTKFSPLELL